MIFAFFAGADVTLLSAADIVTEEIVRLFDLLTVVINCAGGVTKSSFFVLFSSQKKHHMLRLILSLPERKIGRYHLVTNCEVRVLDLILYGHLEARIRSHIIPCHVDSICDQ